MGGSIGDIFDLDDGMALLGWGSFLAVDVQGWSHWWMLGLRWLLLHMRVFLFASKPALQGGDKIMDGNVMLLLLLML